MTGFIKEKKKQNKEIIEAAAERLAEILIMQIEAKKKSKKNNKITWSKN